MVREELIIREEIHGGQVVKLKTTKYITEVSKELAQIKSQVSSPVISTGLNLTSMLSGGGVITLALGLAAKKLREMPPKPKPQPQPIKGRKEEDDAT